MPASIGNTLFPLSSWHDYSEQQKKYLAAKSLYVQEKVERQGAVRLDFIWDGHGKNQNAALTVFRHSDRASVVKGLVGNDPKAEFYSLLKQRLKPALNQRYALEPLMTKSATRHAYYEAAQPGEAGLLDYNRLENR